MRIVRRFTALLIVALVVTAAAAPAALAGSQFMYKSSTKGAQAYWTQVDGTEPGTTPFGNVHIGWLDVFETRKGKGDAFVNIWDWDCLPGTLPSGGPHDEEPDPNCTFLGVRSGEGYDLDFSINNKLDRTQLVGRLTIYGGGHGGEGGVVGTPMANVTWTGVGDVYQDSATWRFRSGGSWYTERYSSTSRSAVMSGNIGPMGFDPDLSGGWMSIFKSMSKGKSR